jgi:hypothetical protein
MHNIRARVTYDLQSAPDSVVHAHHVWHERGGMM